jgi:hypothetical protein
MIPDGKADWISLPEAEILRIGLKILILAVI